MCRPNSRVSSFVYFSIDAVSRLPTDCSLVWCYHRISLLDAAQHILCAVARRHALTACLLSTLPITITKCKIFFQLARLYFKFCVVPVNVKNQWQILLRIYNLRSVLGALIVAVWWYGAGFAIGRLAGCRFDSRPGLLRTKVYSAFHPSGVGKWVPAIAGKAKVGMAHSDCGWTCGCAGKFKTMKSLENTCHTWTLLRWWFTTKRRYIKCMHLYLTVFWLL